MDRARTSWLHYLVMGVLLGGALLSPATAFADSSKDRVKIRKRTTIKAPPSSQSEDFGTEKAAVLAQKRRSLIEDIKRYIRETKDNEQAGELNLRLGSLYMEDYYAGNAKAQVDFDAKMAEWEKKKKGKEPVLDNSEAKASLKKARLVYKELLRRAPKHNRKDEVLYFLAVSSMDEGNTEEGARNFAALLRENPKSKYFSEAAVQLADHYFEKNRFKEAETYYDMLIRRKHLPLLPYATYKKAWCEHNREQYAESIKQFKWVIQFADAESDGGALRIRNEAMRDITLPFVELRATDDAIAFFHSQGDPHYRNGLENLDYLYYDKGNYTASYGLSEKLLALDANYSKNADYEIKAIEALRFLGREEDADNRLNSRLPIYVSQNSSWYETNSSSPNVVKVAVRVFEELTRNYALRNHAQAQRDQKDESYNRARGLYAKYVEFFPNTENTPKMRFNLAEIQFRQGQYVASADNYFNVYEDPAGGKLKNDAIRHALSALDLQLNSDRKKAGLQSISNKSTSKLTEKEDTSLELIAYSPVETKFINIANEYLKRYSTAKDAGDVLYEQSYLRYTHHDFADAYRGFWTMVQKYPAHPTSHGSAYLILDILNRKKEYPKLIAACQKFLDTKEFNGVEFRKEVADILRKAELKRIALIEEKGQLKEAADNYLEYTKTYGTQDEALFEKALYNASVNYSKANELLLAAETQERFLRRFPKSKFKENMLLQIAKTYETLALFDKSGRFFEEFSSLYPHNPQAKNALRLAGVYLGGSGQLERAEAIFHRFLKLYPGEAKIVERDVLNLYESTGATDKQIQYYLQARAVRGVSYADYLIYTVAAAELTAQKTGKLAKVLIDEGRSAADKFGADIRKSPKGVEAMAKLRFWWVSQREALFHHYKLVLPQEKLEANLKRKLLLLQELEKEYGKIASLGNAEWGLGAIYKTSLVYRNMAESVASAPVPAELTAEQLDGYRSELKKQMIDPFNEKAKSYAANCLDKAQEFNVLSPWTAQCYRISAELSPERYPKARSFYLPAMMVSVQMPPKDTKTELGSYKNFRYPFYSSLLFAPNRQLASMAPPDLQAMYDFSGNRDGSAFSPMATAYEIMGTERRNILKNQYESEKPDDPRQPPSFAYANILRVLSASKAIPLIEGMIQKDPTNVALVNLLGLAYLESGKTAAANTCWLSLIARGQASANVWNNLGVAANREGLESQALGYFREAAKLPGSKEAFVNLGFLALKYRNGSEAKAQFKKALDIDEDDVSARAGLAVALMQNREMEEAKDLLVTWSRRYNRDPYLKLSLAYYLIDVDHEPQIAHKIAMDFMESQSLEKDLVFRQLLLDSKKRDVNSVESDVPGIE